MSYGLPHNHTDPHAPGYHTHSEPPPLSATDLTLLVVGLFAVMLGAGWLFSFTQ